MKKLLLLSLVLISLTSYGQILMDPSSSPTTTRINDAIGDSYTATGTDTYVVGATGTFTYSFLSGKAISVTFTNPNTGASTLNFDGLGAKNILKWSSGSLVALSAGDLTGTIRIRYDGTQWVTEGGSGGTSLTFSTPLSETGGVVSIQNATTSQTGALTDTDWDTFNNKAPTNSPTFTGTITTPFTGGGTVAVGANNSGVLAPISISGSGNLAAVNSPVFTTPNIGTATGSITGNAATVTTNANLTGPITSVGNTTSIASSVALPGSPTTTTQTVGTSNTTVSTTAYADNATQFGYEAVGQLTSFTGSVPSSTNVTGTANFSLVAGKIRYEPASSNIVTLDAFTSGFKNVLIEARFTVNTLSGSTGSLMIGLFSNMPAAYSPTTTIVVGGALETTTTNPGAAFIRNLNAVGTPVNSSIIAGDNLALSAGDEVILKYYMYPYGHTVEATKVSNGKKVTYTNVFNSADNNNGIYPSSWKIGLAGSGGQYDFSYINVSGIDSKRNDIIIIGNSITARSFASTFDAAYSYRLKNSVGNGIVYGFPSFTSTDILPYIDALIASQVNKPVVLLNIGANDARGNNGATTASWRTDFATIVGKFITAGWTKDKIIISKVLPTASGANNNNVNTINGFIDTDYSDYERVEANQLLAVAGVATTLYFNADLLHPNDQGHELLFKLYMSHLVKRSDLYFKSRSLSSLPIPGSADAGSLIGTTLNPTVVNSSLTSLGTLVSPLVVTTTINTSPAVLTNTSSTTNAVVGGVNLKATSTGVMVDGFGIGFLTQHRDNSGVDNNAMRIYSTRDGADNSAKINISNTNAGSETVKINISAAGNVSIGNTTVSATDKLEVTGNIALMTAGNKLKIATGSNASVGTATLVSGTVIVSTTAVTASSLIFVTYNTPAGTLAAGLSAPVGSIVAGTSFVINALTTAGAVNTLDTSTVRWWIIN